jgi:uncharacterized RmlC-like cupin family protein
MSWRKLIRHNTGRFSESKQMRVSDMIGEVTLTCQVVSAGPEFIGKHGYLCAPGISRQSVGARAINLQIAIIPPGASAKAHKHGGHETALHILSGEVGIWYGERLEQHLIARAGDFLYIPPDIPHRPYNLSDSETCVAIIARTDPNDQESIVLLLELERVSDGCPVRSDTASDHRMAPLYDAARK